MKKQEVTFVLFGGSGDLVRRKLVPAFSNLVQEGRIREDSTIIGVSRKNWNSEEYKKFLVGSVSNNEKDNIKKLDIRFFQGDFSNKKLEGLRELIEKCERKGCNRIYYLATSFKFFADIIEELKEYRLHKKNDGFTRIVFEKPFGNDLKSSELLDKKIHGVFNEKDVFRLDHYLAKETVQNLNVLKFTNPILYSTLNSKYVGNIQIIVDEDMGVGDRIGFYNDTGAIKDMIQSHLLQILSLILMEEPLSFDGEKIHDEKIKILKNLEILESKYHLLGQYESYLDEAKKVGLEGNNVETFARIVLNCKTKRWDGVELILRTGKKLKKKYGQIKINFKPIPDNISKNFTGIKNNKIVINIYPKQDIDILMNTNTPEQNNEVKPVKFEFCRECEFGPNTTNEYSVLLNEIIRGDKMLFTRSDEVKESWKIVEKIEKIRDKIKFVRYKDGGEPENAISKNPCF